MPEGYLHLTCEQRCQIYALLQSGHSQAHIARQIGVDPSTISRELVRNTGARGYRFKQAHEKASQRREEASDKPRKMTPDLVELIEEKLTQEQWSPDQISGRLAKDGVAFVSHERIYQHVWKDKKDGGMLYLHLRHSGKKYNRRKGKNSGRGLIPNRVDIDQRPPIVAAKSRIGDWEADTIIGANHKGVVMSHVERTSKYTKLAKLHKNADSVLQACARVLLPLADLPPRLCGPVRRAHRRRHHSSLFHEGLKFQASAGLHQCVPTAFRRIASLQGRCISTSASKGLAEETFTSRRPTGWSHHPESEIRVDNSNLDSKPFGGTCTCRNGSYVSLQEKPQQGVTAGSHANRTATGTMRANPAWARRSASVAYVLPVRLAPALRAGRDNVQQSHLGSIRLMHLDRRPRASECPPGIPRSRVGRQLVRRPMTWGWAEIPLVSPPPTLAPRPPDTRRRNA